MNTLQSNRNSSNETPCIAKEWAWNYQTLRSLRDRLLTESDEQLAQAAEPMEAHRQHAADSATDEYDHDFAMTLLSREQSALAEVDAAIERIRRGTYGILNDDVIQRAGITHAEIETATTRAFGELRRREIDWRGRAGPPDVTGKTVLLIDDGIATGFTVQAAAKALRAQFITAIVIGVPVISAGAFELLNPEVDDLTALMIPDIFPSVSQWHGDFSHVSDDQVAALLAEAAATTATATN